MTPILTDLISTLQQLSHFDQATMISLGYCVYMYMVSEAMSTAPVRRRHSRRHR